MSIRKLFMLLCMIPIGMQAQNLKILFLGNSYTDVNNLPLTLTYVAKSLGYPIETESNTPGGCTLEQHSQNTVSLQLIQSGQWDIVVLQEQSQLPAFPITQVQTSVYPYAAKLDSLIKQYNPCAKTVFYQTWGRKYGDASNCPYYTPLCDYNGMDSLLAARYRYMAQVNGAHLSPVGDVWHWIRQHNPSIELYASDNSHPSIAGTYAAACCFATILFQIDPTTIGYYPSEIDINQADSIREATKQVVYMNLQNYLIGKYEPIAMAQWQETAPYRVSFTNESTYADNYYWDFGDGQTDSIINPIHNYSTIGNYQVTLVASKCNLSDTISFPINITASQIENTIRNTMDIACSHDGMYIIIKPQTKDYQVKIINTLGIEILSAKLQSGETQIPINRLLKGHYIIQFIDEKGIIQTFKFIK